MNISQNKSGPRILPCIARDVPIPVAITRSVPQNIESPIPANGPINATFTLLMDDVSKSSFLALLSSIAVEIPNTAVEMYGVVLKNSMWRFAAAIWSSFF